eukprot:m.62946 g.62946  ORF g.62946 m.62946 type:complete len:56 (-) comp11933_c0_seq2:2288-2455(-)
MVCVCLYVQGASHVHSFFLSLALDFIYLFFAQMLSGTMTPAELVLLAKQRDERDK